MKRLAALVTFRLRSLAANLFDGRRVRMGVVLTVALVSATYGLMTAAPVSVPSASADNQTESYQARVAPFTESYRVRVAPFTRTVAAYNYETVCIYLGCHQVRVPPLSRTVAAYNYENRTRAVYNYETRIRSVSHTHTCSVGYRLTGHDTCVRVGCPTNQHPHSIYGTSYCHANHTCPSGQHRHSHDDACHADHTCAVGYILNGHSNCRWVGCPSGQHAHSVLGSGYCHVDHTCPSSQHRHSHDACHADHTCAVGYTLSGHSNCRWVGCPSGQHAHSVLGSGYCHVDHTCPSSQHRHSHDACHADHTCAAGFDLVNHDECRWVGCSAGLHAHSVLGTGSCHADHPACSSGQHRDGHDDVCHADHSCAAGFDLVNHDECRWPSCPSGQHAHSVLGTGSCHADHPACGSGEHRDGHDDACHADHTCAVGYILSGHSSCQWVGCPSGQHAHSALGSGLCHADHTCPSSQHRHSHDDVCHADHTCSAGLTLNDHDTCCPIGLHAHLGPVGSAVCHTIGTDHYPLSPPSGLDCATDEGTLVCAWDAPTLDQVVYEWKFDGSDTWQDAGIEGSLLRTVGGQSQSVSVRAKLPLFDGGFKYSNPTTVPVLETPITECPEGQHKHPGEHPDRWKSEFGDPRECHGTRRSLGVCHDNFCRDIEVLVTDTFPSAVVALACSEIGRPLVGLGVNLSVGRIGLAFKLTVNAAKLVGLLAETGATSALTIACRDDESDLGYILGTVMGVHPNPLASALVEIHEEACRRVPIIPTCIDLSDFIG